MTTYSQANGQRASASVALIKQVVDLYSVGSTLQLPTNFTQILENQINLGAFPDDPTGIYVIMSSSDVGVTIGSSSSCINFCGFHSYYTRSNGHQLKFAWVGDTNRCLNSCAAQLVGPNGDAGMRLMQHLSFTYKMNES